MTKSLGVVSKTSTSGSHACPTSVVKWPTLGWEEGRGYCLPGLQWHLWWCLPLDPHRAASDVQAGGADREVDWKLAECLGLGGGDPQIQLETVGSRVLQWPVLGLVLLNLWMMGQRVASAGLLVMPNWEEWLLHYRVVLPSRMTSTCWRNG